MDFQLYEPSQNTQILLQQTSPRSKNSWHLPSDNSMDSNDEYFSWTDSLKIDDDHHQEEDSSSKNTRKRKLSDDTDEIVKPKGANVDNAKSLKHPLENVDDAKQAPLKKAALQNGSSRMPQWQVDAISDLNADIEGALSLGGDLGNNPYAMNETILSVSGLTAFKQEAPSPTSHDASALHLVKQQSPASTQGPVNTSIPPIDEANNSQNMLNNTLHQLLNNSNYSDLQNAIDGNLITSSNVPSENFNVTSSNCTFTEDCRFQYVLAAATSIATKINEDTLTYLNQGQSYEIKLKKLGDLSMYRGKMLKSIIRICFHERRLQYMEKEQMSLWQQARPGDRILEVDVPLSYGLYDVSQPTSALNAVQFTWDPTKEVGVYIKVNCISTEFTPKKHGGEKGVPFRIQVETYQNGDNSFESPKRLHAAACQIKVFKLKGADRKHKQDREKILKRPLSEQEKYQPSYECTVLNDIPNDAVVTSPPAVVPYSPESGPQNRNQLQQQLLPKLDDVNVAPKVNLPAPQPNGATVDNNVDSVINFTNEQLPSRANPQQTTNWLTANRFDKYLRTFSSFSGSDMLRMSRDDLIQICGHADGIRLFNALHSKSIAPMLTIYVCRDNSSVFNAVFLSTHSNIELLQKLSEMIGIPKEQVSNMYMLGPQSIHVQLSNDVIRHIKEETMFSLEILQENGCYSFLLKPTYK